MNNGIVVLVIGMLIGAGIVALVVLVQMPGYTRRARRSAVQQSRAVTRGQVYEQLVPFLPEFEFDPRDAHFLGRPVDFVVFDGLDAGDLRRIVFVEVKTGGSTLTARERRVRDAVRRGRVEWAEIRLASGASPVKV